MPSKTIRQANAAKLAIAVKAGEFPESKAGSSVKQMAKSMSREQLKHFTKLKGSMNEEQKKRLLKALKNIREDYTGNIGGEVGTGLDADGPPLNENEFTAREKPEANIIAQTYDTEADFDSYVRVRRGIEITSKEEDSIANFRTIRPIKQTKFSVEFRTTDDFGNNDTTVIKKLLQDKQFIWVAFSKHETAEETGNPGDNPNKGKEDTGGDKENAGDNGPGLPPLTEVAPKPPQPATPATPSQPRPTKPNPNPQPPIKAKPEDEGDSFEVKDPIRVTKSIPFKDDTEGADILTDFLQKLDI